MNSETVETVYQSRSPHFGEEIKIDSLFDFLNYETSSTSEAHTKSKENKFRDGKFRATKRKLPYQSTVWSDVGANNRGELPAHVTSIGKPIANRGIAPQLGNLCISAEASNL